MKNRADFQADILSAVAHPNRIRILEKIRSGMSCNCEIAPALGLEQSNLSRHLKILENNGILKSQKEGLRTNYEITDKRIFELLDLVSTIAKKNLKKKLDTIELS